MTTKTPKARHRRFLAAGFFPPEMPSCFYSETLAQHREYLLKNFDVIPPVRGRPAYQVYRSSRASINFPRFLREDRRHSYLNPIAYFFLSRVLSENYIKLRKLNIESRLSVAPSIFDWGGSRALIGPAFATRDRQNSSLNARFEVLAEADITAFYHSIYTHSIAWAVHTKPIAKSHRTDLALYGNLIDLLVRNSQDGQTIGIPVGPDTSRLIAEIVGSAIDRSIQKSLKVNHRAKTARERTGMRFVDDFTFGCSSTQEAEMTIATVREAVNAFELELNNSKTGLRQSAPFIPSGWREHLSSFLPTDPPYDAAILNRYFYNVELAAAYNEKVDVSKYAIKRARNIFLDTDQWDVVQDYLLSSYRKSSTTLAQMVNLIILRQLSRKDVSLRLLTDFVNSRIPVLADLQKNGEIVWLLFLSIAMKLPLNPKTVGRILTIEDGAVGLLAANARQVGLIPANVPFTLWNSFLTVDGLDGPMWLYAYETGMKDLNGTLDDTYLTQHQYFKFLAQKKVEFYRFGLSHFDADAMARAQRLENHRRRLLQIKLEQELGGDFNDFEEVLEDQEDEEEDVYS